jgi:hypothetical protein
MLLGAAESVLCLKTSATHLTEPEEKKTLDVNHEPAWIKFKTSESKGKEINKTQPVGLALKLIIQKYTKRPDQEFISQYPSSHADCTCCHGLRVIRLVYGG